MKRTAFNCITCLVLLMLAMPTLQVCSEENHASLIIILHGTVTIQRDGTILQIIEVGQSYILDPADKSFREAHFYRHEQITERLDWHLDLIIERLPDHMQTTMHGAAALTLENRAGENDIVLIQPVAVPVLASNSNHRIEDTVADTRHTLGINLTFTSQPFTCDPVTDADCDTLPDSLETTLIERFKPMLIFADNEPIPIDEMAMVYQVSPHLLDGDKRTEIMITVVVLYREDKGVHQLNITGWNHLTCNLLVIGQEIELGLPLMPAELLEMPINTHCGDTEALRLLVRRTASDTWALDAVYLQRHDDPWQIFREADINETFTVSHALGMESDHLVLYVSSAKHSMYPDLRACEDYANVTPVPGFEPLACAVTFEVCSSDSPILFDTPPAHNVGERHRPTFDLMTDSSSPILRRLFPGEFTWTEMAFCGGFSEIPEPAYGLGTWCGGSLASKWWPPRAPASLLDPAEDVRP